MFPKVWDTARDAGPALGDGWAMSGLGDGWAMSGFYQQMFAIT